MIRFTFFPSFSYLDVKCYMAFGRGNLCAVNFLITHVGYLVSGYKSSMPNIIVSFCSICTLTEIWNGGLHGLNDFTSVCT
jgi:hypothetical protein